MANTTPYLETVRRVCLLNNVGVCYLLSDSNSEFVYLYFDLGTQQIRSFCLELESWCGMKFKIFNDDSNTETIKLIKTKGERIYPL